MREPRSNDADLASAAGLGDATAASALAERYLGRVFDFAYRALRDRQRAAVAARGAMVEAFGALASGEDGAPRTRVFTAARARVAAALDDDDRLTEGSALADEESRRAGLDQFDPSLAVLRSPAELHGDREAARLVWRAASGLPAWQYIVLDLALRQWLRGADLSRVLGAGPGEAESALADAERSLEARLQGLPIETTRSTRELLAGLMPVPLPVELRNQVWRDVVDPWPRVASVDDVGSADGRGQRGLSGVGDRRAPAEPGPRPPAIEPPTRKTTEEGAAPVAPTAHPHHTETPSAYVSRAANDLLSRTRQERLGGRGDSAVPPPGGRWFTEEARAPATLNRPVRLRPRGDASGIGRAAALVLVLFAAGLGVGVASGGADILGAVVSAALSGPAELFARGPGDPPGDAIGLAAGPSPVPAKPAGVAQAAEPTPTPTLTGTATATATATSTATETPTPTTTWTATATATGTATATATRTRTPIPPTRPPATPTRPPPTRTFTVTPAPPTPEPAQTPGPGTPAPPGQPPAEPPGTPPAQPPPAQPAPAQPTPAPPGPTGLTPIVVPPTPTPAPPRP